jgi:hypothetical protein
MVDTNMVMPRNGAQGFLPFLLVLIGHNRYAWRPGSLSTMVYCLPSVKRVTYPTEILPKTVRCAIAYSSSSSASSLTTLKNLSS